MIHRMRLVDFAYNKMEQKEKTIEIRLNDEKRQQIKVGDITRISTYRYRKNIKDKSNKIIYF